MKKHNAVKRILAGISALAMVGTIMMPAGDGFIFGNNNIMIVSAAQNETTQKMYSGFEDVTFASEIPEPGTHILFMSKESDFADLSLSSDNGLFVLPEGSAELEISRVDEEGGIVYVNVIRGGSGFDSCKTGTLTSDLSKYSCKGGSTQNLEGTSYTYLQINGTVSANINAEVLCNVEETIIDSNEINIIIADTDGNKYTMPKEFINFGDLSINPSDKDYEVSFTPNGGSLTTVRLNFKHVGEIDNVGEVSATCTKEGKAAHLACDHCGLPVSEIAGNDDNNYITLMDDAITIPKLDHVYKNSNNNIIRWNRTYTEATLQLICDNECGTKGSIKINSDGVVDTSNISESSTTIDKENSKITTELHKWCSKTDAYKDIIATFIVDGNKYEYVQKAALTQQDIDSVTTSHEHLEHHEADPKTCQSPEDKEGFLEYWSCSDCGKNYSDEDGTILLDSLKDESIKHNLTKVNKVDPTCSTEGTKEYWQCSDCGKLFSDEAGTTEIAAPESIEKLPHDYSNYKFTWEDTVNDEGEPAKICKLVVSCKNCHKTIIYTATEEGYTPESGEYTGKVTTSIDNNYISGPEMCTEPVELLYNAQFDIKISDTETKTFTATSPQEYTALGHCLEIVKIDGSSYYQCKRCGSVYTNSDGTTPYIPPTPIEPPSGGGDGSGPDIAPHDHAYIQVDKLDPTCTTAGYTAHTKCSCGDTLGLDPIPAKMHLLEEKNIKVVYNNNDINKSYAIAKCSDCDYVEEFEISEDGYVKGAELIKPTCTTKGRSEYSATYTRIETTELRHSKEEEETAEAKDSVEEFTDTIVMNEAIVPHTYNENTGVCVCGEKVANVSIAKTGTLINDKNRVLIKVDVSDLAEGYVVDNIKYYYNNTNTDEFSSVTKTGLTSFTGRIADIGNGVRAYAVVTIKSTTDEGKKCVITTETKNEVFNHVSINIEKTGEKVSSGKNRVVFNVNADVPEGYTVVETGLNFWNDEDFDDEVRTGKKLGVASYSGAVADIGYGVMVEGYVIVKATGSDDQIIIKTEKEYGYYSRPSVSAAVVGTKISSGKNRVRFEITPVVPEGFTVLETGLYYDNTQGNSLYNIKDREDNPDTPVVKAGKEESKYSAAIADYYYGVSVFGYAVFKATDGREFTLYTDSVHGDFYSFDKVN